MQAVQCPHCAVQVRNDGSRSGQVVACPRCRQPFQMPGPLPAASGNETFEDIGDESGPRRRRRRQPSHAGVWILALFSLLGIGLEFPQGGGEQQAKKSADDEATAKRQSENERPRAPQGQQDTQRTGKDKNEQDRAEAARKNAEALRNPTSLQAPAGSGGPGVMRKYPEFAQQMRDLASNEFTFRKAQDTVYRSTFNQRDQTAGLVANYMFFAFNGILDPGSYDFQSKRYSLTLHFWYEYYKEGKGRGGSKRPFWPVLVEARDLHNLLP
jgi:hypothetical protein